MIRITRRLALALPLVLALALAVPAAADLVAGAAAMDITPKRPVPLGGYGNRFGKLSKGVHDRIHVRALYLESGDQKLVWASTDLIGISAELTRDVLAALPKGLGIEERHLLLAATHNHSGPGGMTSHPYFQIAMGFYDQPLYRDVVRQIAGAVALAVETAGPARLGMASERTQGLSRNRRIPGGPTDPELLVLKVTTPEGRLLAVAANFAAHPTVLGGENMLVSGDYPGAFSRALEARFPGAVAMFINGAEGDQSPATPRGQDQFERAEKYAQILADLVARRLDGIAVSDQVALSVEHKTAPLPASFAGPAFGRSQAPLQRIKLGKALLLSIPGELSVTLGLELKARARKLGYDPVWIVGLANDHLGYIVDRTLYKGAGYESQMNFFGPEMDRWFLRHHLLDWLPAAEREAWLAERDPERLMSGSRLERRGGLAYAELAGAPYQLGFQHGRLFSREIKAILAALEAHAQKEMKQHFLKAEKIPEPVKFLLLARHKEISLPGLCLAARKLHRWTSDALMDEMLGVADGAGVPYDHIFLLNVAPTLAEHPHPEKILRSPLGCTNAVRLGEGQAPLLHGRNLDWSFLQEALARHTTVFRLRPRGGKELLSVGYPGVVGVVTAISSAGLSFGMESVPAPDDSRLEGASFLLLLREAAQKAGTLEEAIELLKAAPANLGYHYTVADAKTARTLEVSATHRALRGPASPVLLGCHTARDAAAFLGGQAPPAQLPQWTASGKKRYPRAAALLAAAGPWTPERMMELLSDREGGLLNGETIQQVVMLPGKGELVVRGGMLARGPLAPPVRFSLSEKTHGATSPPARRPPPAWSDLAPDRKLFAVPDEAFAVTRAKLADFPVARWRIEFPSPVKTGHAANDRVYGLYYDPGERARRAVVLLPIWKGRDLTLEQGIASYLALMGFKVLVLPHAWQFERAPAGVRSGDWTISPDLERTRRAFIQTVQDARRAATWLLRDEKVERLAVMGVSLGGIMASLVYSHDRRFEAAACILSGGDLGGLLYESDETKKIRAHAAEHGLSIEQVRKAMQAVEPVTWADRSRGEGVLLVAGTRDTSILPQNARALARAWGVEPRWLECGHYDGWMHLPQMLGWTREHFTKRFAALDAARSNGTAKPEEKK